MENIKKRRERENEEMKETQNGQMEIMKNAK